MAKNCIMWKWMGKVILPLFLMLSLTGISHASYGDNRYGDVIYGDTGVTVSIIDTELALSITSALTSSTLLNTKNVIEIIANGGITNGNTQDAQGLVSLLTQSAITNAGSIGSATLVELMLQSGITNSNNFDVNSAIALISQSNVSYNATSTIPMMLELLAQASISHTNTVDFVKTLALQAVASLEETNQMNAQSALLLSQTITQSNISLINVNSLLELTSQVSYFNSTGAATIDVTLILSAISDIVLGNTANMSSGLSLQVQSNIQGVANITKESVMQLTAQGSIDEAVQLLASASTILNAYTSMTIGSKVDWVSMLDYGMSVQQVFSVSGASYTNTLDLAMATEIANAGGLTFTSQIELSATAQIENLVATAIREGILTLNAKGNYEVASQLAYIGTVLLNCIAQQTITFNQNLTVTMVLNAISTAVTTGDIEGVANIIKIKFDMKSPTVIFELKQSGE